jgi:hypothetical protein
MFHRETGFVSRPNEPGQTVVTSAPAAPGERTATAPADAKANAVPRTTPAMEEARRLILTERSLKSEWNTLRARYGLSPAQVWEDQVRRFETTHAMEIGQLRKAGRGSVTEPDEAEVRAREEQGRMLDEKIKAATASFEKWHATQKKDASLELAVHRWARETPEILGEARRLSLILHRKAPEQIISEALLK